MPMLRVFVVAVLLALCGSLSAQQPGVHADANPIAENEIKALELKLADLIVRGSFEEYANRLGQDYVHIRENGRVETKDETLAGLRDIKRKIIAMELDPTDLVIRIYGDTAFASAQFASTVRDSGQVKNYLFRKTGIFLKRDGQWFLVVEQGTTIGK